MPNAEPGRRNIKILTSEVGCAYSYLLPKQDGGTSQIEVNKTKVFDHQSHPVVIFDLQKAILCNSVPAPWWPAPRTGTPLQETPGRGSGVAGRMLSSRSVSKLGVSYGNGSVVRIPIHCYFKVDLGVGELWSEGSDVWLPICLTRRSELMVTLSQICFRRSFKFEFVVNLC